MVLAMVRPFKHPKTGVYWLRKAVPAALRGVVGKRELVKTLGTKDPAEARARTPAVLAQFDATIAAARSGSRVDHSSSTNRLTLREIMALAGEWYRGELREWGDDPDTFGDLDDYLTSLEPQIERISDREILLKVSVSDCEQAARMLTAHGYPYDRHSATRLAKVIFDLRLTLGRALRRRLDGDWRDDETLAKLPSLPPRAAPEATPPGPPKITFSGLVAGWAAETGTAGKALYDRERTAKMLAGFVGHDDPQRITADDAVRWKEARLAQGRSVKTVANDIGELRPIWAWGKRNRKLTFVENPFAGLAPRPKRQAQPVRRPYTEADAVQLLAAAQGEHDASLRWLPWALCFTGARLGEVTQAVREDIRRSEAGTWFLHIHGDGEGRTLKTVHSERQVPLHPALIADGFLAYVQSLPAGGTLFPDLKPDRFGTLKGFASKKHGKWVRKVIGITDQSKDPAHAWRHRFEDQARMAGIPQPVIDGLTGHLNATNESETYGRGFRFMPDITAPWVAKMAPPVVRSLSARHMPLPDSPGPHTGPPGGS